MIGSADVEIVLSVAPSELASTLIRRHRASMAQLGAGREALRTAVGPAWARACAEVKVRPLRAWLIGSLAWGGFGAESDVDVVVEGLTPEQEVALWSALEGALAHAVDLLRLEDLEAAFQQRVRDEGLALDVT